MSQLLFIHFKRRHFVLAQFFLRHPVHACISPLHMYISNFLTSYFLSGFKRWDNIGLHKCSLSLHKQNVCPYCIVCKYNVLVQHYIGYNVFALLLRKNCSNEDTVYVISFDNLYLSRRESTLVYICDQRSQKLL